MKSYNDVIQGNVELHRKEARFYDLIHEEIWNKQEQKRLRKSLKVITAQIKDNKFRALDLGAGTGNVTLKLLDLGFHVVAVDLSKEMCQILCKKGKEAIKKGQLEVLNLNLDEIGKNQQFDLVTAYSVLHHLPDYITTLEKLSAIIKHGGILYMDRESKHGSRRFKILLRIVNAANYYLRVALQKLYIRQQLPKLSYENADVHDYGIDIKGVARTLTEKGFKVKVEFYYNQNCWFRTPLTTLHKFLTESNSMLICAKRL